MPLIAYEAWNPKPETLAIVVQANEIIADYQAQGFDLTLRQIYYQFVARALIHALGYKGRVKSPTYGLLELYQLDSLQVLHLDLYRINDPGELEYLGLADLMDDQTILLIEWPDRGGQWLPEPDFIFEFGYALQGRDLHWTACSPRAQASNLKANKIPNYLL